MAGTGLPSLNENIGDVSDLRLAIAAASWHDTILAGLLDGAQRAATEFKVDYDVYQVSGSLELPVVAKALVEKYDAVVALGVVIRGGTPHFEYVCEGFTQGIMDVAVQSGVPIGNGVLTCDTEQQAIDRAGLPGSIEDKGYEATIAALHSANNIRKITAL